MLADVIKADKIRYSWAMFESIESKNVLLIYAVIGFGSIALVALGELSGAEPGSFLFNFFLKLVFGGFLIFYSVLFHFATLHFSKKVDKKGPKALKLVFGERSSRVTTFIILIAVLFYWVFAFADLMRATDFRFF